MAEHVRQEGIHPRLASDRQRLFYQRACGLKLPRRHRAALASGERQRLQAAHGRAEQPQEREQAAAEMALCAAVERARAAATAGLTGAELAAPVPAPQLRLNPGDFAPHNILVRPDGGLGAIDFEYACWEDPAMLPAGFLAAEQSD